jgi:hypothetical protein
MSEAKQPGKVQQKVQTHGPWVAIATAAVIPFFSYMQARDESQAARAKAQEVQLDVDRSEREVEGVEESAGAVYALFVRELERVADDANACHERVDLLADELEELAERRGRGRYTATRVMEQRAIERPAAVELPKAKADVGRDDPLRGVLSD